MKILKVTTWNFRNLQPGEAFYFGEEPRVVVLGANEAGKTSLFEAITLAFTLEETSRKRVLLDPVTPYGSEILPKVEIIFAHEGKRWRLFKDWEQRRGELEVDQIRMTRPQRIKEMIGEILGVFSPEAFRFLLLVGQDELVPKDEGRLEKLAVQRAIEQFLGVREGVSPEDIMKSLGKIVGERKLYVGESHREYEGLCKQISDLEQEIKALRVQIVQFIKDVREMKALEQELEQLEGHLSELGLSIRYLEAYIPLREVNTKMDFFRRKGPFLEKLRLELEKWKREKDQVDRELKEFGERAALEERKKNLEARLKNMEVVISELEKVEEEITALSLELKGKVVPLRKELKALERAQTEEKGLRENLEEHGTELEIEALKDIELCLRDVTKKLQKGDLWKEKITTHHFRLRIDDVMTLDLRLPFLENSLKNLERVSSQLESLKRKFGTLDPKELEKRISLTERLRFLEEKRKTLSSGRSLEELKKEKEEQARELKDVMARLIRFPKEKEVLLEGRMDQLKKQIKEAESEIKRIEAELARVCQGTDPAEIEERLQRERNVAEDHLLHLISELKPEEREKTLPFGEMGLPLLKERLQEWKRREKSLLLDKEAILRAHAALKERLRKVPREEELREKEERLKSLKEKKEFADVHGKALRLLFRSLPLARRDAIKFIEDEILERLSSHFRDLSLGKYKGVTLDFSREVWKITLEDSRGVRYPIGARFDLSQGAKQQLFLALRLAFIDALSGDTSLPLFLDDTLSDFDPERAERALDLLRKVSEKRQVILLTCHPEFSSFGHTINIGDSMELREGGVS